MPCTPARARRLLKAGKAAVFRMKPFTIILKFRDTGEVQPVELKLDPGSKVTGIAVAAQFKKRGWSVVAGIEIVHRGQVVKASLDARRALRRGRRYRKTRYRKPRFLNRTRPAGWIAPSLMSRVQNVLTWTARMRRFAPITAIAGEAVKFDMQKIQNPEVSGVEYQKGTLFGYDLREYLLEKFGRTCVYCGKTGIPVEIEHVVPKARSGTDRVSNLVLSCTRCNNDKKTLTLREFLKGQPEKLKRIEAQLKAPLKDAAAVNTTRNALFKELGSFPLPIERSTGGRTKYNRTNQGYPKAHWIDAACVGNTGANIYLDPAMQPLIAKAQGHGSRQMCVTDKYGFPKQHKKPVKKYFGFQTGDIVTANVPKGKHAGIHTGRVMVRATGSFNIVKECSQADGINQKYCKVIHYADGYAYPQTIYRKGPRISSPCLKTGVSTIAG